MSPHLEVKKLDFSYQEREVLKDISFAVECGGFVAIIGPNGSGKSTLLKNISAALTPGQGVVLIDQQNVYAMKAGALAKKMAVVPQESTTHFAFTVMETVLMGRLPHLRRFQGEGERDMAIVRWAMQVTGTWPLKDRLITDISGGERQRVMVARALAQDPQVLLLDEPTAFLDLHHQFALLELLQGLTQSGKLTVIAVLHDLNLAAQFSNQVILLHQAGIFAYGSPAEVLTTQNIRQVYGIEVMVTPNSMTGRFNIIPISRSAPEGQMNANCRVHLICGGGTGLHLMDKLVQNGYQLSCGVLNIGDSDWSKAKALGLPLVEEAPFSPIKPATYQKNQALIDQADVVVLLPIPFGPGNLGNLQQAREAQRQGKTVILLGADEISQRDYTGGQAVEIYRDMLQNESSVNYPNLISLLQ